MMYKGIDRQYSVNKKKNSTETEWFVQQMLRETQREM